MRVSEGNLTQQYYSDYLTILAGEIFSADAAASDAVRRRVHENIVFRNLFLHRMSVDGGFHARVLSAILCQPDDRRVLMDLLVVSRLVDEDVLPVEDWLKREYASAVDEKNGARVLAVAALLRSYISGTNQAAEIIASAGDSRPQSWWQLETRRITVAEIVNPDMYFGVGRRLFWHEFPLDRHAAILAGVPALPSQEIYDSVVCIAGAWFSSLTREEMIAWLNMPQPSVAEWDALCAPLLKCETPAAALSTANWLYASGNTDPAMDLYANIALAFPGTPAEVSSFELIGTILRKSGDFNNAFEAYKSAFIASRGAGGYQMAIGLKNLCEVGEDLGEDMTDYYMRIGGIAEMLPVSEKLRLYLELAASCRRRFAYDEEYRYLELVLEEEDGDEDLTAAAMSRLSEMNSSLTVDGRPDASSLKVRDVEAASAVAVTRGTAAYFGFDPECALQWYAQSGSLEVSSLRFAAALAAGTDAGAYATTPAERAAVLAADSASPVMISRELNAAVTDAWRKGEDVSVVIKPIIRYLSPEILSAVLADLTARSTRDDERAFVCSAAAQALLSAGRVDEARSMIRTALRANPGREMRSRLFTELGWLEFEAGAYAAAADACELALRIQDQFPAAWACRARALAGMGRYDEAFAAAGFAVMQNPSNASYQHLRSALEVVMATPVDSRIDLLFVLPESGYLQASAVEYTVQNTSACPPEVWDVSVIEDVVPMRASLR